MKKFISPAAREDILRQYRYLLMEQASPLAAERFLRAVRIAIREVCKRPGLTRSFQALDRGWLTNFRRFASTT